MEIRHLKTFQAVAETLSFHRAGRRLNYAQSTVSAQVAALEDELGQKLFDRLGRRVRLTDAGERLLAYAGRMIELEREARAEIAVGEAEGGTLVIRIPESFAWLGLPKIVRRFHRERPGTRLELVTCTHDGLAEDLRKGLTDLAFLLTDSITGPDLEVEFLAGVDLVLAAAPDHPLAKVRRVTTDMLSGQTLLLSRSDCSYRRGFASFLEHQGAKAGQVMEFGSVTALKECLAAGVGVTVLPRLALTRDDKRRLVVLKWTEALETGLVMVWLRKKWMSPNLVRWMDITRAEFGAGTGKSDGVRTARGPVA